MPIMVDSGDREVFVPDEQIANARARGYRMQTDLGRAGSVIKAGQDEQVSGVTGALKAGAASFLRGGSVGISDVLGAAEGDAETLSDLQNAHGIVSTVGNTIGAVAPAILTGGASLAEQGGAAGARVAARAAERTVLDSALHGAGEGAIQGLGQGVSELALSDDPLTMERAASVLSSNALFGAAIGGVAGGAGRLAEKGLARGKVALDEHIASQLASADVPADLAQLDAKGLRAAKETELESIKAARATDAQRLVEDLGAHREDGLSERTWRATEGADSGELREIGAMSKKADDRIRNILNNPKAVVENPRPVLSALTQQEHAMEALLEAAPKVKAEVAASNVGKSLAEVVGPNARLAALDKVPAALERNRALQDQLKAIVAEPKSARLDAIASAGDVLQSGAKKGLVEQAGRGALFGALTGAVAHIPVIGQIPGVAHLAGAKLGDAVGNMVFGRLGKATTEVAKRTSATIGAFLNASAKVPSVAPVLASKVLASVRYAPAKEPRRGEPEAPKASELADHFRARSAEIRSQVAVNPMSGALEVRPEARQALADRISAIAARAPRIADQLETIAVRRLEFLANKLPRKPDVAAVSSGGPDRWQPSDYDMRTFARYAAAVEDPGAVEERLVHGNITPEDADAYHTVYPERAAAFTQQIVQQLPMLRKSLPYQKRLGLSIFTGVSVDPSMEPAVLAILQGQFAAEPGTDGGMSAPKAQPQFGSIKKSPDVPTPAQARANR